MGTINITDALLNDLQQVLQKHDESNKDIGVSVQYLAASIGVLTAHFPGTAEEKQDILRQLYDFSKQILESNSEPVAASAPPSSEAFGIWKPE